MGLRHIINPKQTAAAGGIPKIDSGRISILKAIEDLNDTRAPDSEDRVETPVGRAASARSNIQSIFDDVDR